jgi:hypothetical protein
LLDGTTAHVLTMLEHATRRIRILGATGRPTVAWTVRTARKAGWVWLCVLNAKERSM